MKNKLSQKSISFSIGFFITILFILLTLTEISLSVSDFSERKSRDLRFLMRGKEKAGGNVVIAAIDDKSLEAIGRWTWSRSVIAKLVTRLRQGGAKAVAIDLLFADPESDPEKQKIRELITEYTRLGLLETKPENQAFFSKMVEIAEETDHDTILAEAIRNAKNIILPMVFVLSEPIPAEIPEPILPISELAKAASRIGFVNVLPDPDGAVRRGLGMIKKDEDIYLSFSIRAVQKYLKIKHNNIVISPGKEIRLNDYSVPINDKGIFYINYYGADGVIPSYSCAELLNGAISPDLFKDKIVFVGSAATGLGDHWANPFTPSFSGVETHATIADNLLTGRFLQRPGWTKYADAFILALMGIVLTMLLSKIRMRYFAPVSFGFILLFILTNQIIFNHYRLILLWVYPILNMVLIALGIFVHRYLTEGHEKRLLKQAFQRYLNPSVVDRIIENPDSLKLGGEKKELTVLFSDIRGFTAISESLAPESLMRFMNQYLTAMTDIVMNHEGTLDKYIGDAVMAIYGAPQEQKDHAIRACSSAIRMFEILYEKRDVWKKEGLPPIWVGIGINTGTMVVGNMGSAKRFNYTVMGDHVNLASRLEGLTKFYGVKIIVSEFTQEMAKERFIFRELDIVRVKGKQKPVKIFELQGKDYYTHGNYAFIPIFHDGLDAYRKGEWDKAIHFFEECLEIKHQDQPALIYIERCNAMKNSDSHSSSDWDCVYEYFEK